MAIPLGTKATIHKYPRLGRQIQRWNVDISEVNKFANLEYCDLAIIDSELTTNNPFYLGDEGSLKTSNPNLILLNYFSLLDILPNPPANLAPLNKAITTGVSNWKLKGPNGQTLKLFQMQDGNWSEVLNITIPAARTFWISKMQSMVASKKLFDGIFVDWGACTAINWLASMPQNTGCNGIDINGDGVAETQQQVDLAWKQALQLFYNEAKSTLSTKHFVGNAGGGTDNTLINYINGIYIEGFAEGWVNPTDWNSWSNQMKAYLLYQRTALSPRTSVILTKFNAQNGILSQDDYKKARFGLASTLCGEGYYICTNQGAYNENYWLDEYGVDKDGQTTSPGTNKGWLGMPLKEAMDFNDNTKTLKSILDNNFNVVEQKIYIRYFENGVVILNPTNQDVFVNLQKNYKKIKGVLDPVTNNGAVGAIFQIPSRDALILRNESIYP